MRNAQRRWNIHLVVAGAVVAGTMLYAALHTDSPGSPPTSRGPAPPPIALDVAPDVDLAGLTWNDYQGVRLPHSTSDGPHDSSQQRAFGFSRTPLGALLAAIHITVRAGAQWGPAVFEPTIGRQITGPDTGRLLESARAFYERQRQRAKLAEGAPLGRPYMVIEAFRWLGFTPETATVDLVTAGPGDGPVTVRAATRVQVRWHNGDWRVVAPPGGDWRASASPIVSAEGYTGLPERR